MYGDNIKSITLCEVIVVRDLIGIGLIPEPVNKIDIHQHPYWEIVYYTHGSGVISVGEEQVEFEPGDIMCLPPYIPHYEYSENGYKNIHFSVRSFYNNTKMIPKFKDNDSRIFYHILMEIYREFHRKQFNWCSITESMLQVLHQYMLSWTSQERKSSLVEKLENMLVSNIANKSFSIDKALKDFPISKDHFRRMFIKETGKTPLQYLTERRIAHAVKLLEGTSMQFVKISDIANDVGFEDPFYFSRVFKKVMKISPLEWSKKSSITS